MNILILTSYLFPKKYSTKKSQSVTGSTIASFTTSTSSTRSIHLVLCLCHKMSLNSNFCYFFTDCAPLTCPEPLTYGPAESACLCVLPIQVGLRLTVALYTFFPLVSELAAELGASVFMKQSQVRIVGANTDGDDPEKTIVLIDLLPLGEKFDFTTAYLTYKRIWNKQMAINASYLGDFDVLYVRYPGNDARIILLNHIPFLG